MESSSSSSLQETRTMPTLSRNGRISTKKAAEMSNVAQESLAIIRSARRQRRSRRKRSSNAKKMMVMKEETNGCEEDEKAEVESKINALQRIVPGGEELGVDKLFEETADYILALQFQVKALKFLASFVEGSEKEKRKLGG